MHDYVENIYSSVDSSKKKKERENESCFNKSNVLEFHSSECVIFVNT